MTHYTIEGIMTHKPGAASNRFKFAAQAQSLEDAILLFEARLNPERGYKITSIDAVAIQGF